MHISYYYHLPIIGTYVGHRRFFFSVFDMAQHCMSACCVFSSFVLLDAGETKFLPDLKLANFWQTWSLGFPSQLVVSAIFTLHLILNEGKLGRTIKSAFSSSLNCWIASNFLSLVVFAGERDQLSDTRASTHQALPKQRHDFTKWDPDSCQRGLLKRWSPSLVNPKSRARLHGKLCPCLH